MTTNELFGFKRGELATQEHPCPVLFKDKKIAYILGEMAKEYSDIFEWHFFGGTENEQSVEKGFAREQMTLFYDDKKSENGGIEINFYLWGDNRRVVEILAMTDNETENEEVFNNEWDVSTCSMLWLKKIITPSILRYVCIYKDSGVNQMNIVIKEAKRKNEELFRQRIETENQIITEVMPLVMAQLTDDDKKYLLEHPNAYYHHLGLGMAIRNSCLHSREDVYNPDDISHKIIESVIEQLINEQKQE